jgi:protocatechuate 3,4-dioxygenase beta subunit
MSTKTTFKRVALVAVAAMGFGLLSVVPSTAVTQSDTLAISATGGATSVSYGSGASTVITQTFLGVAADTMTVTVSLVSSPTGNTQMPTLTAIAGTAVNGLPTASGLVGTMFDSLTNSATTYTAVSAQWTLAFASALTVAGTYVVKVTPANVTAAPILATQAAAVTWTVTVAAAATAVAADATSTSITNSYGVATGSADKAIRIAAGSSTAGAATVVVISNVDGEVATGSSVVSASVSGPGTLDVNQTSTGGTSTGFKTDSFSGAAGTVYVHLFADGQVGTSTITITVGGATKTETVYFYGAAASVTTTTTTPTINSGSGAVSTAILTATVKDANGNVVPGATVYAVSGTTTVFASASATTGSAGTAVISVLGLTAGTSAVTVQNVATGSTATFSAAAVSIRAGSNVASSVTMTLDKATYTQGEAAILTVTIKDAAGSLVADGTHAAFSVAPTASRTVAGEALPGTSIVTSGSHLGAVTYKINVPTTSGAFTISGLGGADLAAAQAELAISVTATVSQSAAEIANADAIAAAADAAAEATDAANAATDAANAAAEAADAATAAAQDAADAVSALGTQVAELIDGLKAQIAAQKAAITALTNLVIKIQKKIKA